MLNYCLNVSEWSIVRERVKTDESVNVFFIFPSTVLPAQQLCVEKKDRMLVRHRVWGAVLSFLLLFCTEIALIFCQVLGSSVFACNISININLAQICDHNLYKSMHHNHEPLS